MRWSVVRLIAGKELRDLVRDRRTLLLILVLPAVLYPLFAATAVLFAVSLLGQPTVVGVAGAEHLPGPGSGLPPLLADGAFADGLEPAGAEAAGPLTVKRIAGDPRDALRSKAVDTVLVVPPGLTKDVRAYRKAELRIVNRDGDDKSKLAGKRLAGVVRAWREKVVEARVAELTPKRDAKAVLEPFDIVDPQADKTREKRTADELRDTFTRVFPFILIMWLVAGAIQPAVDMTAGERERGTLETLLISPVERTEIVFGKLLATTAFAFTSVVWNVLWLTGMALLFESYLGFPIVNRLGLLGCVVLGLPLAAFFSAVSLAIGVFAKSTKEGQYYLVPLLLVTMPLAFWSMSPVAELNAATSWVPVTGAMLLQQRLLSVSPDPVPWGYFAPVLGSLLVWVAAAVAFAAWQFRREGVLFRETAPSPGLGVFRRLFKRGT
ncbi:MAG TPA: ABC transporter permease [Fimbriiglobus sp.]|nr:ABC transporter permease [Fimbriiglobus sp.]